MVHVLQLVLIAKQPSEEDIIFVYSDWSEYSMCSYKTHSTSYVNSFILLSDSSSV